MTESTVVSQGVGSSPRKVASSKKPEKGGGRAKKTERHNMRLYPADSQFLVYWADQYGMDQTEFLITAMRHFVKWKNQDYDLPTAEIQRLNQMVDAVENLVVSTNHLEKSVVNGFDAMLGIIRGDNYLIEEEDGELS
ncbi:hypothetical protein RKD55_004708 [Rossellomorea marisflavi]